MTIDMRTILNRVAAGELTPEEAQSLLHPAATPGTVEVRRVMVRGHGVRLTVIADPSVDTAVAEGAHRVEHDGDRLVIHSDLSKGEYTTETPKSAFMYLVNSTLRGGPKLNVRVNPSLPLDILTVASSLEMSGQQAPVSIGVEAGSAKISGGRGQLKLSVTTGSADVDWQFTGDSSVSAEMSSAKITVLPGSDVLVTAESSMGTAQIRTSDGNENAAGNETTKTVTVGAGAGRLAVSAKLGTAAVRVA